MCCRERRLHPARKNRTVREKPSFYYARLRHHRPPSLKVLSVTINSPGEEWFPPTGKTGSFRKKPNATSLVYRHASRVTRRSTRPERPALDAPWSPRHAARSTIRDDCSAVCTTRRKFRDENSATTRMSTDTRRPNRTIVVPPTRKSCQHVAGMPRRDVSMLHSC